MTRISIVAFALAAALGACGPSTAQRRELEQLRQREAFYSSSSARAQEILTKQIRTARARELAAYRRGLEAGRAGVRCLKVSDAK